ncbi:MAG TPA: RraA family protein, partial [SAR324 cluster bacterium]|nr:RraA family protein [SAR324 cluster bacterium]
ADPSLEPIVGYARTATIRALSPVDPKKKRETGMAYYDYVASGPGPNISVIQDLDPRPGLGANWGEVNTNIHKALGVLGVITNGAIRDMDVLAPGFQLLAGKIVPSHAYVRIEDSGMEVNIFGMTVRHNDLIHADRHGAVVIPAECAEELPGKIDLMIRREKVILDACKDPGFNLEMLKQATSDSADIH